MHGQQYLVLIYWKEFAKKDPSLFPANKLKPINWEKECEWWKLVNVRMYFINMKYQYLLFHCSYAISVQFIKKIKFCFPFTLKFDNYYINMLKSIFVYVIFFILYLHVTCIKTMHSVYNLSTSHQKVYQYQLLLWIVY